MKLNPQDREKIADLTPEHYNQRGEDFLEVSFFSLRTSYFDRIYCSAIAGVITQPTSSRRSALEFLDRRRKTSLPIPS